MKRRIIVFLSAIMIGTVFTGCDFSRNMKSLGVIISDIDTYAISGEGKFLPVSFEDISDGTVNGATIIEYVNVENKTMWVCFQKFQNGYGISFNQMFDENGDPVLYDGDIDALKKKYGVQ